MLRDSKPNFPTRASSGAFCKMLLGTTSKDGFVRFLVPRQRGPTPPADTIVPASVAFYSEGLRRDERRNGSPPTAQRAGAADAWKTLPEGDSNSASNQLWQNADEGKNKLLAAAYAFHGTARNKQPIWLLELSINKFSDRNLF